MIKQLVDDVGRWDMKPKTTSMRWTSTLTQEEAEKKKHVFNTVTGLYERVRVEKFKILGYVFNREVKMKDALKQERIQSVNEARWRDVKI